MDLIKENWGKIKLNLKEEFNITNVSFRTWIEPLSYYKTEGNKVFIIIQSDQIHQLDYIRSKYTIPFQVTISELMDEDYQVSFVLEKDIDSTAAQVNEEIVEEESSILNDAATNAHLNPKYNFETFVVGGTNNLAYSACLAVAESPGEVYNPLYIYGGPGLGKTHLMHSIGHFILEQNPDKKILYVTSEEFTNEVIESIRSGSSSMTRLRDKYRTVDVLMVDDIQFIIGKEQTQEEFFNTFNVLHSANKQVILSSDKPPKELSTLDERLVSRFQMGLTVDIQTPDYETRMAILRKNAETIDVKVNDDIIEYIATNIKSNIRELEGALNKIIAFAKLHKTVPTLDLAEEALQDMISPSSANLVNTDRIIKVVAESFEVRPEDITSQKRNADYVLPRQVVMFLCHDILSVSYKSISKLLGKKDHTTIIHGVNKISSEIKTNEELSKKIEVIRKKLNS